MARTTSTTPWRTGSPAASSPTNAPGSATTLLAAGWRDEQRHAAGDVKGPYSWWSNRGQARTLDRGWRIDYLLTNRSAAKRVSSASTDREAGLRCSDHAPVSVDMLPG